MAKAKYINGFTLGYSVSAKYVRDSDYHCENDYEIMYVRRGSRQVFVKDRSYVLTDGQLLFINKNELHKTSRIRILLVFRSGFFYFITLQFCLI